MTVTTPTPSGHAVRGLTRRGLLARALTAGASLVVGTGFVAARDAAWAVETVALKPESMAVLIRMARDIYPHDRIPDRYYALAVKPHDDPEQARMIEDGVTALNTVAQAQGFDGYLDAGWEKDRVAMLRVIEHTPFFQTVRSGLVTGLYNQKEVWPIFGYEGESFSHGGYLHRGFDDIDWL
ncbi:Twin-arginine translocation pathway signal [uncultured Paracoccus sp.]|uniref:Twin-arginine translocation pathway signal n=1 Tax=uncultured Paracoccus sp. TaxID=189685 RepID=UPI0025FF8FF1|nr:Twin-arginine translocation pathway signal [uncultured Paracoccus sp.]